VHSYTANGKKFYANSAEPSVPAALASVVLGFRGSIISPLKPRALKSFAASVQRTSLRPRQGTILSLQVISRTIYDLKPLYSSTPAIDGTGQKIVIVGQSNIKLADIATFRSLPAYRRMFPL